MILSAPKKSPLVISSARLSNFLNIVHVEPSPITL
jgi:hypothetical protein